MNKINNSKVGIASYGTDIPMYRISVEEIAKNWGADHIAYQKGLCLIEKSVPGMDEDTISLSVNAAFQAKERLLKNEKIGAVYVGSESHPYSVKPTATIVGEALGLENDWTAADIEFACKAGTAAIQMVAGLIEAGRIDSGLAIGADTAQAAPGDALEYSAAAAGAAFILGTKNVIAKLIHTTSFTSDTPDFWRRKHEHFPKHGGRFTGEPAYFKHVIGATKKMLKEVDMKVNEFDHVVFHMPNGKFPKAAAKSLGAAPEQYAAGMVVTRLGNTYSACSLMGFAAVLDIAEPGQKILVTSYGSGSGSDSFVFEITDEIQKYRKNIKKMELDMNVDSQLDRKKYITYGQYLKHAGKILD